MVAVEVAEHVGADHLRRCVPAAARPSARYTTRSMTGSSGFISCAESSTAIRCSTAMRCSSAMISCPSAGRGSRAARRAAAARGGRSGRGRSGPAAARRPTASRPGRRRTAARRRRRASPRPRPGAWRTGRGIPKRCPSRPRPTRSRARIGMSGSSSTFCGTYPIDRLRHPRCRPPIRTRPAPGAWSPRITRSSVVLPAPFEPISPVNSPAATVKVTRSRICRPAERDAHPVDGEDLPGDGVASPMVVLGAHHSCWVEVLVVIGLLDGIDLGQHPGLEVISRRRHRLIHPDDRHARASARSRGSSVVRESTTCWL